ncbi:hypothetical protein Zm00014a_039076 [Zea mays]|uniref:Uncharacterized protein n=1 Tax=Zea mays TaxID=4577 RepID=A0A3L6FF13_MAIZE|nr:hypothetical protein Zm00014a_039076 [Zea mays]
MFGLLYTCLGLVEQMQKCPTGLATWKRKSISFLAGLAGIAQACAPQYLISLVFPLKSCSIHASKQQPYMSCPCSIRQPNIYLCTIYAWL